MPEYFDISLICKKTKKSKTDINKCLTKLGLSEGENITKYFRGSNIITSIISDNGDDFEEISMGLSGFYFHKESFHDELKELTSFAELFFMESICLKFILCSYELNGYLLSGVKRLKDLDNGILNKFPIIYRRVESSELPILQLNLGSQDIFE